MYSTTIAKAIEYDIENDVAIGCRLYLVRDGDVIFYVGQSGSPLDRLQEHLGKASRSYNHPSSLGRLIIDNHPDSDDWTYELYTPEDCIQFMEKVPFKCTVNKAEIALIQHFSPALNVMLNNNPGNLPRKYIEKRLKAELDDSAIDHFHLG